MISLLLALALVHGIPTPDVGGQITLAPGIIHAEGQMDGAPVHVIRIRPGAATWRFMEPVDPKKPGRVEDLPAKNRPLVAFNGGYFDVDGSPMGLMVHGGSEINPLRKADWGIFWINKSGQGRLHHRRKFHWPSWSDKVDFAVECGPRVRVGGEKIQVRPGAARRTLVGIREDGDLVVAIFPTRVELGAAGQWLHDHWEVVDLLNLDGGSSTQLALCSEDRWLVLARGVPVPAMIGIYPVGEKQGKKN